MGEKRPRLVIAFHTTAAAIATEKLCRQLGMPGRLIPAPRSITSDCGMSWSAPPEIRADLERQLAQHRIETAGSYLLELYTTLADEG